MRRLVPHVLLALLTAFAGVAAIGSNASRHPLVTFEATARVCNSDAVTRVTLQATTLVRHEIESGALEPTVFLPSKVIIFSRPEIVGCPDDHSDSQLTVLGEGLSLVIGKPHLSTYLAVATDQTALIQGSSIFPSALHHALQVMSRDEALSALSAGPWSLTDNGTAYANALPGSPGQKAVFFRMNGGQPQFFYAACLPAGSSKAEIHLCRDVATSIIATNLLHFKSEAPHL